MLDEDTTETRSDRAKGKLRRDIGSLVLEALEDPKTVEVLLNPDGRLWQERLGEGLRCIGNLSNSRGEAVIKTIAGFYGKEVTH
jgi:type IV secretion system protein VirB11